MRRVLVVDDSPLARATLRKRIESAGMTVDAKESVADCAGVDAHAYDAALLDFDLGDGTGADVATSLRASAPELPIAFFTASEQHASADAFGPVFTKSDLDSAIAWLKGPNR